MWYTDCGQASVSVKELNTPDLVLCYYHPTAPVCVATLLSVALDLSCDGIKRPIAFTSRFLSKSKKGYSHIDKEAL